MSGLPVYFWIEAQRREIAARGDFVTILQKGDRDSGMILIKIRKKSGVLGYEQGRDEQGRMGWYPIKF